MADNKFFNLFNDIDDKYIKEAEQTASGPDMYIEYVPGNISKRKIFFSAAAALAACAALVFGIVKLSGLIHGLDPVSESTLNSSSGTVGDATLDFHGTPIPDGELEEFDYAETVNNYRRTFSGELTAVLDEIGKPEVTDVYCKAITLAAMMNNRPDADIVLTDKAKAKKEDHMRANISFSVPSADSAYPDSKYEMYETGYSYDSFCRAFRDVFGEESAEDMIIKSRYGFVNHGNELYCSEYNYKNEGGLANLVHTDYELITNTDDEVVFYTVLYFDYSNEWFEKYDNDGDVGELYDPAENDTYFNREGKRCVCTQINRFVKTDGVWKAEDIYYEHSQSLNNRFTNTRADTTGENRLDGEPLPTNVHTDFEYNEAISEYTEELKKDEGLTAFLEQIGDGGFTEQYYKARTLAELVALNNEVRPDRSECMGPEVGARILFYNSYNEETTIYLELGYKYDSFLKTLHETFGDDTVNYLLERGTYYNYNNELYYRGMEFRENPLLVHNDYRLVFQSEDEIIFDTLCYHIRPEEYNAFLHYGSKQPYNPSKKTDYVVTKVTNRFVKENGKWKAEEICFLGDLSSVGEISETNEIPVSDNIIVTGKPLSESELVDFTYEEVLENYRKILAGDMELTAVLRQINKPDFTESYYRARTLADMLMFVEGAEFIPSDKVRTDHEPATLMLHTISSVSSILVYNETGYKYEGFDSAFRDVFGGDNAEKLLKRFGGFPEYNGELYFSERVHYVDYYLAHIGYELKTNTDSEIVIDSVCYFIDRGYLTTWTKPTFHPEDKDSYIIKRVSNRFVKENGKWKAAEICMANGASSLYDPYDPTNQETVTIDGKNYTITGNPSISCSDFDYSGLYNAQFGDDKQDLRDFLDSLANPEAADAYLGAAAVTDGFYGGQFVSGIQGSAWIDGDDIRYFETGCYASDFFGALRDIFTVEASTAIPERSGVFFTYNGELYQCDYRDWELSDRKWVSIKYELIKNTDTEIEFDTIIRYSYSGDENENLDRIKNRIVYQEGLLNEGWRVEEMCILNYISSNDPLPQTVR